MNSKWSDINPIGILMSANYSRLYLAKEKPGYSLVREIWMPPDKAAIEKAIRGGIRTDVLNTYFAKVRSDLEFELSVFDSVESKHAAKVTGVHFAKDPDGPGWRGFIRTNVYIPMGKYFGRVRTGAPDAVRLGMELCDALTACKGLQIVHGEINPSNVMVAGDGRFVLTNFAVRRCFERAGKALVTPEYPDFDAPEVEESAEHSALSDIYSLGMLMAYIANGSLMPQNRNISAVKGVDADVMRVIRKATSYLPEDRYQTASEMKADIMRLSTQPRPTRKADIYGTLRELVPDLPEEEEIISEPVAIEPEPAQFEEVSLEPSEPPVSHIREDSSVPGIVPPKPAAESVTEDKNSEFFDVFEEEPEKKSASNTLKKVWRDRRPLVLAAAVLLAVLVIVILIVTFTGGDSEAENPDGLPTEQVTTSPEQSQSPAQSPSPSPSEDVELPSAGVQNIDQHVETSPEEIVDEYILPTDTQLISASDLDGMTRQETYMVINEIYARHGKIFKTTDIQEYFAAQSWYSPVTEDSGAIEALLSDTEKSNLKTIIDYQTSKGYR